jgi:hypothetical protein
MAISLVGWSLACADLPLTSTQTSSSYATILFSKLAMIFVDGIPSRKRFYQELRVFVDMNHSTKTLEEEVMIKGEEEEKEKEKEGWKGTAVQRGSRINSAQSFGHLLPCGMQLL